jgi:D-galactose 1-dehydrogenase
VIFATWHSQYNAAVDEAKKRLAGRKIRSLHIEWKEDVRRWHPGQEWIWDAGNFGVFDPGINALSILTKIMPAPAFVRSAELVYPENRDTPIAASLVLTSLASENAATKITAEFDWRQEGDQSWNIDVATADGTALRLSHGGSKLLVGETMTVEAPMAEYEGIYRHFGDLLEAGASAMDGAPFQLVADAFLVGRRTTTKPFVW